jgi:hypothetical protein
MVQSKIYTGIQKKNLVSNERYASTDTQTKVAYHV